MTLIIAMYSVIIHSVMLLQNYNILKINVQIVHFFFKNYQHCPLFTFLMCEGARDNKQFPKQCLATLWVKERVLRTNVGFILKLIEHVIKELIYRTYSMGVPFASIPFQLSYMLQTKILFVWSISYCPIKLQ